MKLLRFCGWVGAILFVLALFVGTGLYVFSTELPDPAKAGLIGSLIGGGCAIAGGVIGHLVASYLRNRKDDEMTHAHSNGIRTRIPIESGQRFQKNPDKEARVLHLDSVRL